MKVSVIVPVYNEEKYITACLEHLLDQEVMADEIIVINNNCTDHTLKLLKKFPVTIVHEKTQGISHARNKGFDTATGTIIARTDGDTQVPRDWVKRIKETFKDPDVIALTGPAKFYDVPEVFQVSKVPMKLFFSTFRNTFQHNCLYGANLAIRKSAWKKVRSQVCMDDAIVHEDVDLALHMAKYGTIIFDSSLIILASPRRWKRISAYYDQINRYLKTVKSHHESMVLYKRTKRAMKIFPRTKRFISANASSPEVF